MTRLGTRGPRTQPSSRFGPQVSGGVQAPPVFNRGRVIASRSGVYSSQTYVSGLAAGATYRAPYICRQTGRGVFVEYGNWSLGGEAVPSTSIWVSCSIELADGSLIPLYKGSEREVEIRPGKMVSFEAADIGLVYGQTFYVRTYVRTAVDADNVPQAYAGSYTGMWRALSGDYTITAPGSTTNTFVSNYGPICVRAQRYDPSVPCVALLSDSIGAGQADLSTGFVHLDQNNVGPGWLKRAFDLTDYNVVQASVPGARLDDYVTAGFGEQRLAQLAGCTGAVIGLSSNDMAGGVTSATVLANLATLIGRARDGGARKIGLATIFPRVTSTDTCTTLANQTVPSWSTDHRLTVNAAIRAGDLDIDVVIDGALLVEEPTQPGKWQVDVQLCADGSHPLAAGYSRAAPAVNTNAATWR